MSGHVSPVRYLKPAPLCSRRITGVHRSYGRLRLPVTPAPFLAVQACPGVRGVSAAPVAGSPWLPRPLCVRLDPACDPGWARAARHTAVHAVACWRLDTIGPFPCGLFGTLHLHGQPHLLPLHLACFPAYASSTPLPPCLQGWIPGPWLAASGAGVPPARVRDIAMPQPRLDPEVCVRSLRVKSEPVAIIYCSPSEISESLIIRTVLYLFSANNDKWATTNHILEARVRRRLLPGLHRNSHAEVFGKI